MASKRKTPAKPKKAAAPDLSTVTYIGVRHGSEVFVDPGDRSKRFQLDPRLDVLSLSPTGFSWGIKLGNGPAQLALAVLCHALPNVEMAMRYYQRFKHRAFIDRDPNGPWVMTHADVMKIIADIDAAAAAMQQPVSAAVREPGPMVNDMGPGLEFEERAK